MRAPPTTWAATIVFTLLVTVLGPTTGPAAGDEIGALALVREGGIEADLEVGEVREGGGQGDRPPVADPVAPQVDLTQPGQVR